jgi:hypothetical protein
MRERRGRMADAGDEVGGYPIAALFAWLHGAWARDDARFRAVATTALTAALLGNAREPAVLEAVVQEWCVPRTHLGWVRAHGGCTCNSYAGAVGSAAAAGFFLALVDAFAQAPTYPCHLPTILSLILYTAADPAPAIRQGGP